MQLLHLRDLTREFQHPISAVALPAIYRLLSVLGVHFSRECGHTNQALIYVPRQDRQGEYVGLMRNDAIALTYLQSLS